MATLKPRGKSWQLSYTDRDGRRCRVSLGPVSRKEAEAVRQQVEGELRGHLTPTRGVTAGQVIADYLAWSETERPDGWRNTQTQLKHFLADWASFPAEGLNPAHVEAAMARRGRVPASQAKSLRMARAAFRRAVRVGLIRINPMDRVSLPRSVVSRAPPWYTPQQVQALAGAPHGAVWAFMVATGIRRGEMAKAVRTDIRAGKLYVESTAEGRTKSGKWRAVPLSVDAKAALDGLGEDKLIDAAKDTLSDWFGREAKALALPGTLHWLRHTFCTHLAQAGVSAHDICKLAGHSSVAVTEIYMHHAPAAGQTAVDRMAAWSREQLSTGHGTTMAHAETAEPKKRSKINKSP